MNERQGSGHLLAVSELTVAYKKRGIFAGAYTAVEGVSFSVSEGMTLGVVGESGSGKSTIGRAILGLVRPAAGTIRYRGEDITTVSPDRRRKLTSEIQVVFQDPYSSMNPSMTIGDILSEPLTASGAATGAEARERIERLLDRVSLPAGAIERYPREFSGGQRQRIAIARALVVRPQLVVCDEPTSALDLTTQAQVLDLMRELQEETGVSYLFISHDLAVVRQMSHDVIVLNRGRIVERGATSVVTSSPQSAYTQLLLAAAPVPDPVEQRERRARRAGLQAVLANQTAH